MKTDTSSRPTQRPGGRGASLGRRMLKVGLAFVTAVLLLNLLVSSRGLPAVLQAHREFDRAEQSLRQLKAQNAALRRDITRLRKDTSAIEEVARRELGYIAPGEKVFYIHDVSAPASGTAKPPAQPAPDAPPAR